MSPSSRAPLAAVLAAALLAVPTAASAQELQPPSVDEDDVAGFFEDLFGPLIPDSDGGDGDDSPPTEDADDPAPDEVTSARLGGNTALHTSATVAQYFFDAAEVDTVLVASDAGYADGLTGGPAAAHLDAPLVLTDPDELRAPTAEILETLAPQEILLLGGPAAVSDEVETALGEHGEVERLWGDTRHGTAAAVAQRAHPEGAEVAYLAADDGFADALGAGAVAGTAGAPVLLTDPDALTSRTADALGTLGVTDVIVLGGTQALSDAVVADVQERVTGTVERVQGADRTATAAAANRPLVEADSALLVTARGYADALAAVAAGGARAEPVLLLDPSGPTPAVEGFLRDQLPGDLFAIGGREALPDAAVDAAVEAVRDELSGS